MHAKAAITVYRPREEVQRLWQSSEYRPQHAGSTAPAVTFMDAPGDRGTEIHAELEYDVPVGRVGELVSQVTGGSPRAKLKDELRHFKQRVETGEIPRSDSTPEGESVERKLKQRPAQPLTDRELEKAGVR